jgi:hypothetical protein
MFKSNSRFAALNDELNEQKKDNTTRRDNNTKNNNNTRRDNNSENSEVNYFKKSPPQINNRYYRNRYEDENEKKLREEKIKLENEKLKEAHVKEVLSPENFPSLIETPQLADNKKYISFADKLKSEIPKEKDKKEIDPDFENLKPGWALSKKDTKTGKIITMYKESLIHPPIEKTEQEIGLNILDALVKLYERQTEEYIAMWGYDTWEKLYRFPNYDYEYFDKLDELYEEMENEDIDISNYETNDTYY